MEYQSLVDDTAARLVAACDLIQLGSLRSPWLSDAAIPLKKWHLRSATPLPYRLRVGHGRNYRAVAQIQHAVRRMTIGCSKLWLPFLTSRPHLLHWVVDYVSEAALDSMLAKIRFHDHFPYISSAHHVEKGLNCVFYAIDHGLVVHDPAVTKRRDHDRAKLV